MRKNDFGRKKGVFAEILSKSSIRAAEKLPEKAETDLRVLVDRLGHYYLCLPRQAAIRSENQAPTSHHGVVSLDPGVRTFQTFYSADGQVTEWG